ncbi:hypothetical protein KSF_078440 [Reticulibacter mediterranei]|uniref:Uncharacterized protein n=1 Tax=Reticulibacter mediterranei TaxID=2778369 RepID=A0A8J3ING2_9CHLR|nr:hypothetical protein KSF_078440 [Reticulibacter mediterranei]
MRQFNIFSTQKEKHMKEMQRNRIVEYDQHRYCGACGRWKDQPDREDIV